MTSSLAACRNTYLLMRHGHSEANQQGRIVSSAARGLTGYGLSARGRRELESTLETWRWPLPDRVLHSDFLRTTQTAVRLADHFSLQASPEPRLRERDFGELEGQPDARYAEVWAEDARTPDQDFAGVEPVEWVAVRLLAVIRGLEQASMGECLLLVSHGDPLQILLTALEGRGLGRHRDRTPLPPGGVAVWPPFRQ
ncbi:histidine phosphatase family protein [Halomonas sp. 18H]|uniref:histidine phosphatase family protein n=1 Tax=Halomonas almeriensis TaxID=308163 RepID=UPI0022320F5E|nr:MULTISPECIES: histidine phosphatase family protein [Halomonas]MCW4151162.1 histidine phosphatase family protein [Halomonas sp. 18H]MDN3553042.1 histidine phosphatase family protein [Halomonas almeriensis]